jgi:hypothetical protein
VEYPVGQSMDRSASVRGLHIYCWAWSFACSGRRNSVRSIWQASQQIQHLWFRTNNLTVVAHADRIDNDLAVQELEVLDDCRGSLEKVALTSLWEIRKMVIKWFGTRCKLRKYFSNNQHVQRQSWSLCGRQCEARLESLNSFISAKYWFGITVSVRS